MTEQDLYSRNPKKLYRSRDKVISGVCGGIAERMGWDPTIVRIAFAVFFFTGIFSTIFIVYLVLWAVTPVRPYRPRNLTPEEETFWTSVSDRPTETFSSIKYRFRDMDERLATMERIVTSDEWRLRRQFKDLEGGA